jgi:4-hydroxy-tetrahydrodipicolinate synthase
MGIPTARCPIHPNVVQRPSSIENIVGIKDSSGDLGLTTEYMRLGGLGFSVLAGNDQLILATLLYGGHGCIASTGNVVPDLVVGIYDRFVAGDITAAGAAQARLAPLRHAFGLGTFPCVIKEALNIIGISVGRCRAPVGELSPEARQKLTEVLRDLGLV